MHYYDLEWYVRKGIPLDLHYFTLRAIDTGDQHAHEMTSDDVIGLLSKKIEEVSFDSIKDDIVPFIKDDGVLKIWGKQYFNDLVDRLKSQ